jgi:cytochrome c oxidase assembly protein subunit 15
MPAVTLFRRLAVASTIATFIQISIGGLVRATKSGLGCGTDWPDCGGTLVPAMESRAQMIEFSHRAAASVVVVLLAILLVVALWSHRDTPRLVWASAGAFGGVLFQAGLGAAVVIFELKADLVVLHLAAALTILALLVYISASAASLEGLINEPTDIEAARVARNAAAAVLALMLVGSYVTGRGAGFVFPDWPLMNGRIIPDLSDSLYALHFAHRVLAAIVGIYLFVSLRTLIRRRDGSPGAGRLAITVLGLFAAEVVIGALNVWSGLNGAAVTAHLMTATAIWGCLVTAVCITHPAVRRVTVRSVATREPALEGSR